MSNSEAQKDAVGLHPTRREMLQALGASGALALAGVAPAAGAPPQAEAPTPTANLLGDLPGPRQSCPSPHFAMIFSPSTTARRFYLSRAK